MAKHPAALASALAKAAYALGTKALGETGNHTRLAAGRATGILNRRPAQATAVAGTAAGTASPHSVPGAVL